MDTIKQLVARCAGDLTNEEACEEEDGLWYCYRSYAMEDAPEFYTDADRAEWDFEEDEEEGTPPSSAERAALPWPQNEWWGDRDRITYMFYFLLHLIKCYGSPGENMHERLLELSDVWARPDMRTNILDEVRWHANRLWGDPSGGELYDVDSMTYTRVGMQAACPGWRHLTSLRGCPKELRLPMHKDLLARRSAHSSAMQDAHEQ